MKTSEAKTDSARGEDRVPDTGLTRSVKDYAREEVGFDLVGIAAADDPQFDIAPEGHKPAEWLPGARSVVVGGIKVLRGDPAHHAEPCLLQALRPAQRVDDSGGVRAVPVSTREGLPSDVFPGDRSLRVLPRTSGTR